MSPLFYALTDIGLSRERNEDAYVVCPEAGLLAVADGIGGLEAGEIASRLAVDTVARCLRHSDEPAAQSLREAVLEANRAVIDYARWVGLGGRMGTTMVVALFRQSQIVFTHVGDSRIYCIRNREITQKSMDHSLLNEYLQMGVLKREEAPSFPYKNIITKALGMGKDLTVLAQREELQEDDVWLLCTDGLTDMLKDSEILDIVYAKKNRLDECCKKLIQKANQRGGKDNITVAMAFIQDS